MKQIPIMRPYFDDKETTEIEKVISSGWVAQGPKVAEFEGLVAEHEGAKYGVATTSCTTALHLLMKVMGLNSGYDIIIPSYTFIATANAAVYTGATVVLADVDTETYNINCIWLKKYLSTNYAITGGVCVNQKSEKELFGIVAVNLFGLCANIPELNQIAAQYNIKIIEDSACALGATINKVHEGAFGNPSCLSFHPRKSITTGEGGMILTDVQSIADKARKLRSHSAAISEVDRHKTKGYLLPDFDELGFNYRMNDIQAAVGVAQMKKLDEILRIRKEKARSYDKMLEGVTGIRTPFVPKGFGHAYQSYVCMIDNEALGVDVKKGNLIRNEIMEIMDREGIATRQGTHAVHNLGFYKEEYGYKSEDLPGANKCDKLSISLPLFVQMEDEDQKKVVSVLKNAIDKVKGRKC